MILKSSKSALSRTWSVNVFFHDLDDFIDTNGTDEKDKIDLLRCCINSGRAKLPNMLDLCTMKEGSVCGLSYKIVRDEKTGVWLITCSSLCVISFNKSCLKKFVNTYTNMQSGYCFDIYETPKDYIVVCLSHSTDDIDITEFGMTQRANVNHIVLSKLLGAFVELNVNYSIMDELRMYNKKYVIIHSLRIGDGEINKDLLQMSKYMVGTANSLKFLPNHYLYI
jgi:hypothetical protein